MVLAILTSLVAKLLWIGMILLFFAGGVTYAFDPHLARKMLKRSLVMLVILLLIKVMVSNYRTEHRNKISRAKVLRGEREDS